MPVRKHRASLPQEEVIERFKIVHENKYDYSKVVYLKARLKVEIICPKHGSFWQTPDHHSHGIGCPGCKRNVIAASNRSLEEDVVGQFNTIHGNKYNYSKIQYINNYTKVEIICPIHGFFWQTPNNHISGQGCRECAKISNGNHFRLDSNTIITRFKEAHGDKYDYSKVDYKGAKISVEIICPEHGSFFATPDYHKSGGSTCPKCSRRGGQISKAATEWLNSLGIKNLIHEHRFPDDKKHPVDGYDPDTNTVYQFHGDFWHGNPARFQLDEINSKTGDRMGDLYEATLRADQRIRDRGYNLVVMWEYDWNIVKSLLS